MLYVFGEMDRIWVAFYELTREDLVSSFLIRAESGLGKKNIPRRALPIGTRDVKFEPTGNACG